MNRIRASRSTPWLPALLAAMTLVSFWPVCHNEFIKFDDGFYLVYNPHVTGGLTLDNIGWAFRTGFQGNWHPLTWLSHMLDVQLFGLRPGWHHFINLLLHVANSLLLLELFRRLTGSPWRSFFLAGLFALHPLHVESVAWASERKDVLSTFFFLLTLAAYAAYAKSRSEQAAPPEPDRANGGNKPAAWWQFSSNAQRTRGLYAISLGFFTLALMSKPMVVTTPLILLLLDYWPLERFRQRAAPSTVSAGESVPAQEVARGQVFKDLLREKIPFFALALVSSLVTFFVQQSQRAMYLELPFGSRVANALVSYCKYLILAFWPTKLAIYYPHPQTGAAGNGGAPLWLVLAAVFFLLIVSGLALVLRRRSPWFTTGWFWYGITLVPVIGLIQVGGQAMADRYMYIPSIGLFAWIVWSAAELVADARLARPILSLVGALVLLALAVLTHAQTQIWHSDFTVFSHALTVSPQNALAHYHVGIAYRDRGDKERAKQEFQAALEADRTFALAYSELGALLESEGKDDLALALYEQAVKASPWAEQIHNHLGSRLWISGKQEQALAEYAAALRCNPDFADAHFNLGLALTSRGQLEEAIPHFRTVCRLRPGDTEALACLGEALLKEGHLFQAADCFQDLIRLAPTNAEAHQNLGLIQAQQGDVGQAMAQFKQAVQLKPDWPDALNALAWVLATHPRLELRNGPEAVRLAERACQLSDGKQARYWSTLDVAYAETGRFADAINAASKAKLLSEAAGQTNAAQAAEARLQAYRQQKPYR